MIVGLLMPSVLHLTLHRKWFADIASKKNASNVGNKNHIGVRGLEERKYDVVKFRNGYAPNAPEMLAEFRVD